MKKFKMNQTVKINHNGKCFEGKICDFWKNTEGIQHYDVWVENDMFGYILPFSEQYLLSILVKEKGR